MRFLASIAAFLLLGRVCKSESLIVVSEEAGGGFITSVSGACGLMSLVSGSSYKLDSTMVGLNGEWIISSGSTW